MPLLDRMNEKAKELGMTNTIWNNPSGSSYFNPSKVSTIVITTQMRWPTKTTARDLAILVYHFIKEYPDILNYTNQAQSNG